MEIDDITVLSKLKMFFKCSRLGLYNQSNSLVHMFKKVRLISTDCWMEPGSPFFIHNVCAPQEAEGIQFGCLWTDCIRISVSVSHYSLRKRLNCQLRVGSEPLSQVEELRQWPCFNSDPKEQDDQTNWDLNVQSNLFRYLPTIGRNGNRFGCNPTFL